MEKYEFLDELDYFLDRKSIETLLHIVEKGVTEYGIKYEVDALMSDFDLTKPQALAVFDMLRNPESLLLYEIISRVLKIKDVEKKHKEAYILDLFADFSPDAYKGVSDTDLSDDVKLYIAINEDE